MSAMGRSRVICLVFACGFLSACIPFPHKASLTPVVTGEIRAGDSPAAALPVRAVAQPGDGPCEGKHAEAVTDGQGAFVLRPVRELQFFHTIVMAHRFFEWNLCVHRNGAWEVVSSSRDYTLGDTGPWWISRITCDLGNDPACKEEQDLDYTEEELRDILGPD